ncbi:MAG: hypothetical protein JOY62_11265 [Acidobacteriaceae bacterium]|nr:hypothetical protein [Acidobacteriaceae bacterium]MBV9780538.1 hypothetical protein [Acidobacteriaceae bacterium]
MKSLVFRTELLLAQIRLLAFTFGVIASSSAHAQDYQVLHAFTGVADGAWPLDNLIRDAAGNLYGTTQLGGQGNGVVFKLDIGDTETVLHSFTGYPSDGALPVGNLIRDSAGTLYGTTAFGGTSGFGTVFKLNPAGAETVLYNFTLAADGSPYAGLVRDSAGNLYGTTSSGGIPCNCGVVFKVDTAGNQTVLYTFAGGTDGGSPFAGLIRDTKGDLYGTTFFGGDLSACGGVGCGVVFKVDPSGNETVLYSFKGGSDGLEPAGTLVRDAAGNLYGTPYEGGCSGAGTVFKIDTAGHETILHTFAGGRDGANPYGGLILDAEGNLYGTTTLGGIRRACPSADGCGTVFRVDARGRETILHRFTAYKGGGYPQASLMLDNNHNLYGTTYAGGPFDAGVIFKLKVHEQCDEESDTQIDIAAADDNALPATQEKPAADSRALRSQWDRFQGGPLYRVPALGAVK